MAVTRAASAARPDAWLALWSSGPSSTTLTPIAVTTVKIAGQQRQGSTRRANRALTPTLTRSEQPSINCTAASEPVRSAPVCAAKPPLSSAAPASHNG
jgi:hypothetical protein